MMAVSAPRLLARLAWTAWRPCRPYTIPGENFGGAHDDADDADGVDARTLAGNPDDWCGLASADTNAETGAGAASTSADFGAGADDNAGEVERESDSVSDVLRGVARTVRVPEVDAYLKQQGPGESAVGTLEELLCEVGSRFHCDEEVAVIETDKVAFAVIARHAGIITKVVAKIGDEVKVGQVIYETIAQPKDVGYDKGAEDRAWRENRDRKYVFHSVRLYLVCPDFVILCTTAYTACLSFRPCTPVHSS